MDAVIDKKTRSEAVAKFRKFARRGSLYAATITSAVLLSATYTSNKDYTRVPQIEYRAELPKPPEINYTVDLYTEEARQVAEESYKSTGRYDIKELKGISDRYFEYLKSRNEPADEKLPSNFNSLVPIIRKVAHSEGISAKRLGSIVLNECYAFIPCIGPDGELGLMQINTKEHSLTAKQYGDIFDPETNITIGAEIYKKDLENMNKDFDRAIMAYNIGPDKAKRKRPPKAGMTYLYHANQHIQLLDKEFKGDF